MEDWKGTYQEKVDEQHWHKCILNPSEKYLPGDTATETVGRHGYFLTRQCGFLRSRLPDADPTRGGR